MARLGDLRHMARQLETSATVKFGPGLHAAQNEHTFFPLGRCLQSGLGRRLEFSGSYCWKVENLFVRESKGLILLGQSKSVKCFNSPNPRPRPKPRRDTDRFQPSISAPFPIIFITCPLVAFRSNYGST